MGEGDFRYFGVVGFRVWVFGIRFVAASCRVLVASFGILWHAAASHVKPLSLAPQTLDSKPEILSREP